MAGGHAAGPGNPPKKRALFNKSKRAPEKVAEDEAEESVDFFSRAKELFPIIVAEKERDQKKKAVYLDRKRSSIGQEVLRGDKKRRLSGGESASSPEDDQKDGALWTRRASTQSSPGSRRSRSISAPINEVPQTSLAERYKTDLQAKQHHPRTNLQSTVYVLSDSDEDVKPVVPASKKAKANLRGENSRKDPGNIQQDHRLELDEDEEFPELAARARERARQKQANQLVDNTTVSTEAQGQAANDPAVEIFISSVIEGSKPIMMKRKISQSLKMVRLIWCDKQTIDGRPLDPKVKSSIFLTWRNQRLFDITTCRAMGLKADENGKLISGGDGFDPDGRIHMEAWNEELFVAHQRMIEEERRRLVGNPLSQLEAEPDNEPELEPEPEILRFKLIVRARNLPDFKTIVKETTSIAQIMSKFRAFQHIEEEKDLALHFDGDKLEADTTCGEADLGDMDVIEAHVR